MTRQELIAALKEATVGSRALDGEFHLAVGSPPSFVCRSFTTSLDAAISAIPNGCSWLRNTPTSMSITSALKTYPHLTVYHTSPAIGLCLCILGLLAEADISEEKAAA